MHIHDELAEEERMMTFTDFLEAFCRLAAIADMPSMTQVEKSHSETVAEYLATHRMNVKKPDHSAEVENLPDKVAVLLELITTTALDSERVRNHDASVSGYMRPGEKWQ